MVEQNKSNKVDVAIIGGGISGLAAAIMLCNEALSMTILEMSPKLGGRCYSYLDKTTGDVVDNGQHVLVGAYHETLKYLDLIGTRHYLKNQPALQLHFIHPTKGRAMFKVSNLPKPFHITEAMLKFKLLSFSEKRLLLMLGQKLYRWNQSFQNQLSSLSIDEWLDLMKQSENSKKCFWYPIAVSIMNEIPSKASALLFARSLHTTFFGKKFDSSILIPSIGQTSLYVDPAVKIILSRGGQIYTNTEVIRIELSRKGRFRLITRNGRCFNADYVISTIPYYALEKIIPIQYKEDSSFVNLGKFKSSPIISVNLWFCNEFMDVEFVGLIDTHVQWLFNKRKILQEKSSKTSYLSAVISGAHDMIKLSNENILKIVMEDINRVFPESRKAKLIHSVIIKERRATFSPSNEINFMRPYAETSIKNFFLSGDWTYTGLPGTIEGAVMSGFNAARLIKEQKYM